MAIMSAYFLFMGNQCLYTICFSFFFFFVSLVGIYFFMPESPFWLLNKDRDSKAYQELSQTFEINHYTMSPG
jgi:hypothetical protein